MSELDIDRLCRELTSEDTDRCFGAARQLVQMHEAGAACLARALVEYPGLTLQSFYPLLDQDIGSQELFMFSVAPPLRKPPYHLVLGLIHMGREALPEAARLLNHSRREIRCAALGILKAMENVRPENETQTRLLLDGLCQSMDEDDILMRITAAQVLPRLKGQAASAFPTLAAIYRKTFDSDKRRRIAQALVALDCSAEVMADVVAQYIRESDWHEQYLFYEKARNNSPEAVAVLFPIMLQYIHDRWRDQDYMKRECVDKVAEIIGSLGVMARAAILELAHSWEDREREMALKAIQSYPASEDARIFAGFVLDQLERQCDQGELGHEENALLTRLREAGQLSSQDEARWSELQQRIHEKLNSEAFVDESIRDLNSNDLKVFRSAAVKAKEVQVHRLKIAAHLLRIMETSSEKNYCCESTLVELAPFLAALMPRMTAMIREERMTQNILKVIEAMGPLAAPETPRLAELLSHPSTEGRLAVLEAIRSIGPATLKAMPELLYTLAGLLEDTDAKIRWHALLALNAMGGAARPVASQLQALAQAETEVLAGLAKESLARIAYAKVGSAG